MFKNGLILALSTFNDQAPIAILNQIILKTCTNLYNRNFSSQFKVADPWLEVVFLRQIHHFEVNRIMHKNSVHLL